MNHSMENLFNSIQDFKSDLTINHWIVAIIVLIIGLSSSTVLIFETTRLLKIPTDAASSWLGALCLAMGILGVYLSLKFKMPILIAWSTAGSALLITTVEHYSLNEVIGAFIMSALITLACSLTGLFEKIMNIIPKSIASALLAGTLLQFSLKTFGLLNDHLLLVVMMFMVFIFSKKLIPQLTMLLVVLIGIIHSWHSNLIDFTLLSFKPTELHFTSPEFSLSALMSMSIPLFIITLASQNITGFTLLKNNGFNPPVSKIMNAVASTNILTSFFGGFILNMSALASAIALGPDSHKDPSKRYCAGVTTGLLYILVGGLAGTITSLFAIFPEQLIKAIAGFALLNTIFVSLKSAFHNTTDSNDAAFITFIIAASQFKIFSIGPAFWAILIGLLINWIYHLKLFKRA